MVVDKRDQLVRELGTDAAQPGRRAAIRRAKLIIGAVCLCIAAGLVWFTISVVRGVPTNPCKAALGPIDELERLAGRMLVIDDGVGGERECDIAVWDTATPPGDYSGDAALERSRSAVAVLAQRHVSRKADLEEQVARDVFESTEVIDVAGTKVTLALAGPTTPQHALLMTRGQTTTRVRISRKIFDADKARAYARILAR